MNNTPKWGSPEFNEAIKKHDEETEPVRDTKDVKYKGKPKSGKIAKAVSKEGVKKARAADPKNPKHKGKK